MEVSVIIPVYNSGKFLEDAVKSVLMHENVKEVLLIEDGSADNSYQICESLKNKYNRIKLLQHPGCVNKGAGASRNLGIINATCEYISFLDSDDTWTANRFIKELDVFNSNTMADGVYGVIGSKYLDKEGGMQWEKKGFVEGYIHGLNKELHPDNLFDYLIGYKNPHNCEGHIHINTLTLKRSKLSEHEIYFEENLHLHQDTVFIWQCAYYLKLFPGDLRTPGSIRGIHKGNRYIFHHNIADSRSKMYKSILNWCKQRQLELKYTFYFKRKYWQFSKPEKLLEYYFTYLLSLLIDKEFFKNSINTIKNKLLSIIFPFVVKLVKLVKKST